MPDTMISKLTEHFDSSEHKTRVQGGRELMYLAIDSVINRLNSVFGVGYDTQLLSIEAVGDYVVAVVRIHYTDENGRRCYKDGVGVDKLLPADPDKSYKTAYAEAIKKAAHQLGVGLYLWDEEERQAIKAEQRASKHTPRTPPAGSSVVKRPAAADIAAEMSRTDTSSDSVLAWLKEKGYPQSFNSLTDPQIAALYAHLKALPNKE